MNEIKRAFEHWMRSLSQWRKFPLNLMDGFEGGYEAGAIAMKEKAAKRVEGSSCAETCKHCQSDPCGTASAEAIRALPLSGAEEARKEKA